jgi:predicted histone-like DNA-binding protein
MALLINSIFRRLVFGNNNKDGAWYASLKFRTPINLREIVTAVAKRTSMSEHDTRAVISVLSVLIPEYIKNGHTVHLGDLGIFRLGVSSTGHEKQEEVSAESIKSKKIRFLPGVEMKKAIKDARFIKIDN